MSINSSSSFNLCPDTEASFITYITLTVARTLLILPLSSLVLYLGLQRWRQQRSFATTSHSDIFTYNMAALELIGILGSAAFLWGFFAGIPAMVEVGFLLYFFVLFGLMFFHVLTCVERYLAVVHPVTYMGLRQSGGARIRNISIVVVWLLSFGWGAIVRILKFNYIHSFCSLAIVLIIVSFCSLRVLCVLIRPGPGEVGGAREGIDQSKQRVFHTMVAITSVLWLWFLSLLISLTINQLQLLEQSVNCLLMVSTSFFNVPSSLVLPLLFLHRAGKLSCCC